MNNRPQFTSTETGTRVGTAEPVVWGQPGPYRSHRQVMTTRGVRLGTGEVVSPMYNSEHLNPSDHPYTAILNVKTVRLILC